MIEGLVGNSTAEKVLLYIENYGEGYSSGIATTFNVPKSQVYKQLLRLEAEGLLVAQQKGNIRLFRFNPRLLYLEELRALLKKVLSLQTRSDTEKYYREGQRPRRTGKRP
ncbi:MAG: winged helix-turn-helix domain-containing protein [Pseudobdellovibrionaceae bacterium]